MQASLGAVEIPTFDQAFADVLVERMASLGEDPEEKPTTGDDDLEENHLRFLLRPEGKFLYAIVGKEEQGVMVWKILAMEQGLPEGVSEEVRNQHWYYLGAKQDRLTALGVAAMFSDDEGRVFMMPTIAALQGK